DGGKRSGQGQRAADPDRVLALCAEDGGERERDGGGGGGRQEFTALHGNLLLGTTRCRAWRGAELFGANRADHRGPCLSCQSAGPLDRARLPRVPQVGAPLLRSDDPRLLTGRGRYVDDLVFPRLVHVAFVRSVHAHALIAGLELDAARAAPGVVAVLSGEDTRRLCKPCRGVLLHYQGMKTGAMLPLAVERVRYVGEPVVAIAAETRAAAEDAAGLVRVAWTPQPAVLSPEAAVAPGAPLIHAELGDNVIYDTRLAGGARAAAPD